MAHNTQNTSSNINATNNSPTTGQTSFTEAIHPKQYLGVVAQYWWVILLCLLAGTGIAAAYCIFATPLYRATCRYELFRESTLAINQDNRARPADTRRRVEDELSRQIVIMKSGSLHKRVMEQLRTKWDDKIPQEHLQPKIGIQRVRDAQTMVDINVDAVDPDYAKDYLDTMLSSYKDIRREETLKASDKALANLRDEQEDIKRELQAARDALAQFRKKHNLLYTRTKSVYDERFLSNLVQRENSLKMEETVLESQFKNLKDADTATIKNALKLTRQTQASVQDMSDISKQMAEQAGSGGSAGSASQQAAAMSSNSDIAQDMDLLQWSQESNWQMQQAKKKRLEAEYEHKLKTYQENHPKMVELEQAIESAKRDLKMAAEIALKRLQARYDAVKLQLKAVREAAKAWRKELDLSTEERAEFAKLQAKVERLKELHDRVYKRILDGSVINVNALFSRLIEPTKTLPDPVWPAKAKIMVLAIIASLGLGVGGAFTLDYFDTRFLDIMAVEDRLNLPYISGIPDWRRLIKKYKPGESSTILADGDNESATETYRALRTAIDHNTQGSDSYILLVTSGDAGEGKSMTSLNLAVLYALSGKKVLMVDGDLRRGSCHRELGAQRTPGLCEFFTGQEGNWQRLVQKTNYTNLDFISSGQYKKEVPDLLSSTRITNLFNQWRKEYDMILMDSAPAGQVTDSTLFANASDGVMLVVNHGKSNLAGSVRHVIHRLPDANLIGFCLNSIDLGQSKYNYYTRHGGYNYGHYVNSYNYYYSKYTDDEEQTSNSEKNRDHETT